jgi:hypothetical protein
MTNTMTRTSLRAFRVAGAALMATLLAWPAFAADRLRDKDVKDLMERIDHERDRFEDQLDGKLKDSIIRGSNGEVNVGKFLDDLQDNVGKMKDRFKPDYAASTEVETVLRQGTSVQKFMATQPPNFGGASEWNRLSGSLGELAAVYATSFPLAEGAHPRRMNDEEVRHLADDVANSADRFKDALDNTLKQDTTIDKTTRENAVKAAELLKKDAEKLSSTIGDEKPASGEAQALLQHAAAIRAGGHTAAPATQASWMSIETGLGKIAEAFKLPAR